MDAPIDEKYYKGISFWEMMKDPRDHVGKVVAWTRSAPWGCGEIYRDFARLVRITPSGRAVICFTKGGKVVTRTVRTGSLLVPGGTGGFGRELIEHANATLAVLGLKVDEEVIYQR